MISLVRNTRARVLPAVLLALLLALFAGACASTATAPAGETATAHDSTATVVATNATTVATSTPTAGPTAPKGMKTIHVADLPPEGRHVLGLIAAGGPFPYSQDGVVFQNREKLLPKQSNGYYHEYTVPTPGSDDRGARRIVAGSDGELYYTDDHYDSFRWIAP